MEELVITQEHNIYILFNHLISRICHCEGVSLLPYNNTNLPSIYTGPDVPKEQENFNQYCHKPYITSDNKQIFCIIKLQIVNKTYQTFKREIFEWMLKNKIWIKVTRLSSTNNTTIGWLQNADAIKSNINYILEDLKKELKQKFLFNYQQKN